MHLNPDVFRCAHSIFIYIFQILKGSTAMCFEPNCANEVLVAFILPSGFIT